MFYNAKSGSIQTGNTDTDYVTFGSGKRVLVMIPGLGDGFKTVKSAAKTLAIMYRVFASEYKVYVFSRKNKLENGCSTRDMAKDLAEAMKALGIIKADFMGVSQGGMIAQYVAIDYPDLVNKLVLAVTLSRKNETVQKVISSWIEMAEVGDYRGIMLDTAERSYSEGYIRKYRPLYSLLGRVGKPGDFGRFIIQATACMNHDCYSELHKIKCPALVIGGGNDKVAGPNSSRETAKKIEGSELVIYEDLGHAAYEEAKDFNVRVLEFLKGR